MSDKPAELTTKQTAGIAYAGLGAVFGITAAAITFFATWIYCALTYGFVLGLGLGWFPAAVCAGVIGWLVAIFWGVALLLLVLVVGIAIAFAISLHSTFLAYSVIGGVTGFVMWRIMPRWLTGREK
jgi:hypothetical protein